MRSPTKWNWELAGCGKGNHQNVGQVVFGLA